MLERKACFNCRERNIKYDDVSPTCDKCDALGLGSRENVGQKKGIVRSKNPAQISKRRLHSRFQKASFQSATVPTVLQIPTPLVENEDTVSTCFFFSQVVYPDHRSDTGRGIFENILPLMKVSSARTACYHAVSATSALVYRKAYGDARKEGVLLESNTKTLQCLNNEISHPGQCDPASTLLAILLLQFQESLEAMLEGREAHEIHFTGAALFIQHCGFSKFNSEVAKSLLLYLLHIDLVAAIRQRRRVRADLYTWFLSEPISRNPSTCLENIGISLASIQYSASRIERRCNTDNGLPSSNEEYYVKICQEVRDLHEELVVWPQCNHESWHPRRWKPSSLAEPPVIMYADKCEMYPSIQIATMWVSVALTLDHLLSMLICLGVKNTWRSYYLKVFRIKAHLHMSQFADSHQVQHLIDSICYSIPFYLGNRTRNNIFSLAGGLSYPAYYNQHPDYLHAYINPQPDACMSIKDDVRYRKTFGLWHALAILCELVTFLSSSYDREYLILRDGQEDWIHGQLLRTVHLLNLKTTLSTTKTHSNSGIDPKVQRAEDAQRYARIFRDKLLVSEL